MNALKRGALAAVCSVVAAMFLSPYSMIAQGVDKGTQGRTIYVDPITGKRDTANVTYDNKPIARGGPTARRIVPTPPPGFTPTTTNFTNSTPVIIPATISTVTSTITVSGAGPYLFDLDLTTFLAHTFSSDLDVTLMSPAGTIVTITTDNGAGNDSVFNGTLWDDDANPGGALRYTTNQGLVTDHLYTTNVVATPLVPEESFGAFIGENPNGVWTMTISDDAAGDGGRLSSWTLTVTTLPSTPTTALCTSALSTPLSIPDSGFVNRTLTVSCPQTYLLDLNMRMNLTHTFNSDLSFTLTSPAGTIVTVSSRNGSSFDNVFNGTYWDDDADTTGQVPYTTNTGLATDHPYANLVVATPLEPEESFAAFIGENPNGVWTLTAWDQFAGDSGSVTFGLDLTTVPAAVTNTAPTFVSPTPTCGSTLNATVGTPFTFTVRATDATGQSVTLTSTALPTGATMTPSLPTSGNPVQSVFNWTPTAGQTGIATIIYTATDNATPPLSAVCTLRVSVSAATDPNAPSCVVTQIIPGPPKQIRVTIQDTQSGLASIVVVTATNATVSIPSFTVGTTSPVVVVATKTNQALPSTVVLRATDVAGNAVECDPVYTTISAQIPQSFALGTNYPNPFNPATKIKFNVARTEAPTVVTLTVYDLLGREVKQLMNEPMQAGEYFVEWDGTDAQGKAVTSGVYITRMTAGDFVATQRMALMK